MSKCQKQKRLTDNSDCAVTTDIFDHHAEVSGRESGGQEDVGIITKGTEGKSTSFTVLKWGAMNTKTI